MFFVVVLCEFVCTSAWLYVFIYTDVYTLCTKLKSILLPGIIIEVVDNCAEKKI